MIRILIILIGLALTAGAVVYLTAKLTVAFLKSYKKKKQTKLLAAQVKKLIGEKGPDTVPLDDLDDDDVILAEYDEEEDKLVQDLGIARDVDQKMDHMLRTNGGVVVFE